MGEWQPCMDGWNSDYQYTPCEGGLVCAKQGDHYAQCVEPTRKRHVIPVSVVVCGAPSSTDVMHAPMFPEVLQNEYALTRWNLSHCTWREACKLRHMHAPILDLQSSLQPHRLRFHRFGAAGCRLCYTFRTRANSPGNAFFVERYAGNMQH